MELIRKAVLEFAYLSLLDARVSQFCAMRELMVESERAKMCLFHSLLIYICSFLFFFSQCSYSKKCRLK